MNTNKTFEAEARLQARLVAEAAAERPEFSQTLHDKVMRSIREVSPPTTRATTRRVWSFGLVVAGSAAAAAVVLAVWFGLGDRNTPPIAREAPPQPVENAPAEDETPLAVVGSPAPERLATLVDATFAGSQWAYLDHDAQLATSMILDQIPATFSASDVP